MDFKMEAAKAIAAAANMNIDEIIDIIEVPADTKMGDLAFPCFKLAKTLRKAPPMIAKEIGEKIEKSNMFEKIEVVNAYVNFYVDKLKFVSGVIGEVLVKGEKYGESNVGEGKNIVIDYSSPNIAKPFHVGHLRSTVIGNALYNIYNKIGYHSISVNHLGDWGTQFGKMIVAYKLWGDKEAVERDDVKELSRIYVKYHEEAEKKPEMDDEARSWLVKMQNGDEEAISLWKWFCEISMKEFNRIYDRLGIKFDSYAGESFYNDKMDAVVEEIREKNLLKESEGAQIVDLEEYNMPPCLILRSDGGTLYPTRDISAAIYRKKEYDFAKCLYVTALDQNLHFAQWFKVVELMGYDWASDLVHIPFGLVSLQDSKLSTRKGHVVLMEDILNSAVERALNVIEEKNPDLPDKEKIAEKVGIGAVIFNDLYNSRIKNVVFDLERMINFIGETGPYVQYTYARCCSILRKTGKEKISEEIDYKIITDENSMQVCRTIGQFEQKLIDAANKNEPYIVSRYLVDLCQEFSGFYDNNRIVGSDEDTMNARAAVVYAVKTVIKSGMSILGIDCPEQM
ncbi:MAG: arginine--tRNA ligase [Firmicutes bacterium]|nr:arginine--tRNA ligase [Bacillota bacterium]